MERGHGLHLGSFDFDIDAAGEVESHERIDRLIRWLVDVDEAVMGSQFEVLHRLLVDVRAADNAEAAEVGGQRHRSLNSRTCALCGVNNFLCGLVDDTVIVRAETYSTSNTCNYFSTGSKKRLLGKSRPTLQPTKYT